MYRMDALATGHSRIHGNSCRHYSHETAGMCPVVCPRTIAAIRKAHRQPACAPLSEYEIVSESDYSPIEISVGQFGMPPTRRSSQKP